MRRRERQRGQSSEYRIQNSETATGANGSASVHPNSEFCILNSVISAVHTRVKSAHDLTIDPQFRHSSLHCIHITSTEPHTSQMSSGSGGGSSGGGSLITQR